MPPEAGSTVADQRAERALVSPLGDQVADAALDALGRDVVDDAAERATLHGRATASSTIAATAVTSPVVIITPMLLETIDVTIIVAMPATNTTAAAMRKAFSVTRPSSTAGRAGAFGLADAPASTISARGLYLMRWGWSASAPSSLWR